MKRNVWLVLALVFTASLGAPLAAAQPAGAAGKVILVVGATGRQGGAVARELLQRGYQVRGLTRNPDSDRARAVAELGAEMVRGDLGDPASLDRAVAGVYGVYAMTDFWEHGYEGEVQHGKNIADAAKRAGAKHFVYSSVGSADRSTGIPHFDSKYEVEKHLRQIDLPHSIVRPVSFMSNYRGARSAFAKGVRRDPRDPDSTTQSIAVRDIGRMVAEAFDHPDEWMGRAVDLAGDSFTLQEETALLARVLGKPVRLEQVSWEEYQAAAGPEMTIMMKWFDDVGYSVDVEALRERYPWLMTLEEYLVASGW